MLQEKFQENAQEGSSKSIVDTLVAYYVSFPAMLAHNLYLWLKSTL